MIRYDTQSNINNCLIPSCLTTPCCPRQQEQQQTQRQIKRESAESWCDAAFYQRLYTAILPSLIIKFHDSKRETRVRHNMTIKCTYCERKVWKRTKVQHLFCPSATPTTVNPTALLFSIMHLIPVSQPVCAGIFIRLYSKSKS